jgi:aryl sulfotransferase
MSDRPSVERVYQTLIFDSSRWEGFTPRDGDVFVCTSYKAGTTWTQMICALLIHQTPDLPKPLATLSPWLDMRTAPIHEILDELESQPHRRLIKTHTALDGLPYFDDVTYLVCGRDPRDVFMSMQNHMANLDVERVIEILTAQGLEVAPPPPLPEDINDRFALWLSQSSFAWEEDGLPYWSHLRHAQTFWTHRHRPNIHFLHYADLKADLEGEMRRIAGVLGVEIAEDRWPALVKAAGFAEMKARASDAAPDVQHRIWKDNGQFFHKGENAQWRGVLSDDMLALYAQRMRARYDPVVVDWLERGSGAVGDPKTL